VSVSAKLSATAKLLAKLSVSATAKLLATEKAKLSVSVMEPVSDSVQVLATANRQ
jgi:hypothetical protein